MKVEINIIDDVLPPVAVTAVNIMAQKNTSIKFLGQNLQQGLNILMTVGGYMSAAMGWGGQYSTALKNLGMAAAPGVLISLYNKLGTPATPASIQSINRSITMNRVSRYPGPAPETPYQNIRLV